MPFLFNAEDTKTGKDKPFVIELDFFELPEGMKVPTLTVINNEMTRNVFKSANKRYSGIKNKVRYHKNKGVDAILNNDPEKFCITIIDVAYSDSTGLFETPSKELFVQKLREIPQFCRKLGVKLANSFEGAALFKQEEDEEDEKNS